MFLYIMEDESLLLVKELQDGDLQSADDGYMTIIDVSVGDAPKQYWDGEWKLIPLHK